MNIKVVATDNANHFFNLQEISRIAPILKDEDEWACWKQKGDPVLHIQVKYPLKLLFMIISSF